MNDFSISGRAAIVGLGATEFSKNSGRTEVRLAMEATLQALADAGIDPSEVDGFSSYSVDKVPEYEIARLLGAKNIHFFSQVPHGGGAACAPVLHAAMAVATGNSKFKGARSARMMIDGIEAFKSLIPGGLQLKVISAIADGDKVAVECEGNATTSTGT